LRGGDPQGARNATTRRRRDLAVVRIAVHIPRWGLMAESVELATIWLVDLVGSTRLATAVGPVRADELRDEFFALLREAIHASGGKPFEHATQALDLSREHGYGAYEPRAAAMIDAVIPPRV
jgi:class 3 adenylate cyclase